MSSVLNGATLPGGSGLARHSAHTEHRGRGLERNRHGRVSLKKLRVCVSVAVSQ